MLRPVSATLTLLMVFQQTPRRETVFAQSVDTSFSPDQSECIQSLLLDRRRIPSAAFTATSEQTDPTGTRRYSAEYVRVENTDHAWCPGRRVGTELEEFVQIDLGELHAITKVVISGLLVEGGGSRFTPHFYIRYKREANEQEWRSYRQLYPVQTTRLTGSSTALVPKFVVLNPPIITRWIRIYPYRESPGFVCIRLEAYGCRYTDDLVEYQIPEGSISVPPHHAVSVSNTLVKSSSLLTRDNRTSYYVAGGGPAFSDTCYDGYRAEPGSLLDGGLGCLTDLGIAAENSAPKPWTDPVTGTDSSTSRSSQWFVGWHRSRWTRSQAEQGHDVVDMRFRFGNVRSFKRMKLYTSNNFPNKIRLPRRIEIRFSVHGLVFSEQPTISQDLISDNRTRGIMNIELDLDSRIGKFVQLKLFFADEWLLLSEIKFYSHIFAGPVVSEEMTNSHRSRKEPQVTEALSPTASITPVELADFSSRHLSTVIILALLIVTFLLVIGFTCSRLLWRRKYWHTQKNMRYPRTTARLEDCSRVLASSQAAQFFDYNGTLPQKSKLSNMSPHSENLNHSKSHIGNRSPGSANPTDVFPQTGQANQMPLNAEGLMGHHSSLLNTLLSTFCHRVRNSRHRPLSRTGSDMFHQTKCVSDLPTSEFVNSVRAYPTTERLIHGNQCSPFDNGQTGMYFGPTGHLARTMPHTAINEMNRHSDQLRTSQSVAHNGHSRLPQTSNQLSPNWFMHSGYSNSATSSTGASVGIGTMNPDVNLYTTVGGESDGDSNCASTMSPEYASTNPIWTGHVPQPPYQHRTAQIPIVVNTANALRPLLPTSLTFSTLPAAATSTGHLINSPTSHPLIYFNHALSGLTSLGQIASPDTMPVRFYNPYPLPITSAVYFPQPYPTVVESVSSGEEIPMGFHKKCPDGCTLMSVGSPDLVSQTYRDASAVHAHPTSKFTSHRLDWKPPNMDMYSTPEETHPPSRLDPGGIDSGPWIKANRFDQNRVPSGRKCPPVPSTPLPPPPPPIRP